LSRHPVFETFLMRAWLRRGWVACLLWPLSLLFRALVAARRRLYISGSLSAARLPVPVIVVGNIFIGGTGKTPFTIWLVEQLRRAGYTPGVISRGYGSTGDAPLAVDPASDPAQAGDEPVLIAQRTGCPVMVGRRRAAAAQALLQLRPQLDVIVADDGLQHYALARDVEILLCDARGAGNGWLLPAGPLREPASRRRDFTVFNADRPPPGVPADAVQMRLVADEAYQMADPARRLPLSAIAGQGRRIAAAAGIGHPDRFFGMLRRAGLAIEELPLPDHHDFADDPFAPVTADFILITEKDAVKCKRIDTLRNDPRLWVVPATACIDAPLAQRIVEKCRGRPTA
jgi:tetraacyldisaccharide 4'-kinase